MDEIWNSISRRVRKKAVTASFSDNPRSISERKFSESDWNLMAEFTNALDGVRIAAPCSADWDQMFALDGDRIRFCSECNLNVYNLSEMTRTEAEDLINQTEGRLCVRFYRRADGAILTQDCLERREGRMMGKIAAPK